jgi:anti-sigma regulatory factor (Ser/Thr protein kinase)
LKELVIDARVENLDAVLDFVTAQLEAAGCPVKLQTQIAIAVEEIFVNIAHYAYSQEAGGAAIRVAVGDEVVIEFEDNGKPFNPLLKDDPDIGVTAEEREIGGLGIFMVKKIMDTVDYRYEDGKNVLVIKKNI